MPTVDLHLHTTYSDGRLSPTELVELCGARGLRVVAVTDHDTTDALPEALDAATNFPEMTVIPGVELGTDVSGGEIHLLGYFVDYEDSDFQDALTRMRDGRVERARGMVKKLNNLGINISWDRVLELSGDGAVGRPHIAQAMVEGGYIRYPRDAFAKYLGRSGSAYVEREKLTPVDAVDLLVRNGALPVMAHPTYSSTKFDRGEVDGLRDILVDLKDAGLVGMEVYYGDYTADQVRRLAALAEELGLVSCGGSDYHAAGNPGEREPGSVGPPLESVQALDALRTDRAGSEV